MVRAELEERDIPRPQQPLYVRSCYRNPHRDPSLPPWLAYTCKRAELEAGNRVLSLIRIPRCCGSWRCSGCRDYARHQAFARFLETLEGECPPALERDDRPAWLAERTLMLTLTLDGDLHELTTDSLYAELSARSNGFRAAFRRLIQSTCGRCYERRERNRYWARCDCGKCPVEQETWKLPPTLAPKAAGLEAVGGKWFATVEMHRSGVPHVNNVIFDPMLARLWRRLINDRWNRGLRGDALKCFASTEAKRTPFERRLYRVLNRFGFGFRSFCEPPRNLQAVVNYVNGSAADADGVATRAHRAISDAKKAHVRASGAESSVIDRAVREINKDRQLPVNAPEGMRRIRSAKGWLVEKRKSEFTGVVLKTYVSPQGDVEVRPLVQSKRADLAELEQIAVAREYEMIRRVEAELAKETQRAPLREVIDGDGESTLVEEWGVLERANDAGGFHSVEIAVRRRAGRAPPRGDPDPDDPDRVAVPWYRPRPPPRISDAERRHIARVRRRVRRRVTPTRHMFDRELGTWHDQTLVFYGPARPPDGGSDPESHVPASQIRSQLERADEIERRRISSAKPADAGANVLEAIALGIARGVR